MFDITELYYNDNFNNLLIINANRKKIYNFDDFKQDVFLEIIDTNCKTMKACKTVANRVAKRHGDMTTEVDIMDLAYEDDNGMRETSDEAMGRLVYHNRARYV